MTCHAEYGSGGSEEVERRDEEERWDSASVEECDARKLKAVELSEGNDIILYIFTVSLLVIEIKQNC